MIGFKVESAEGDVVVLGVEEAFKVEKKQAVCFVAVGELGEGIEIVGTEDAVVALLFIVISDVTGEHNVSACDEVDGGWFSFLRGVGEGVCFLSCVYKIPLPPSAPSPFMKGGLKGGNDGDEGGKDEEND